MGGHEAPGAGAAGGVSRSPRTWNAPKPLAGESSIAYVAGQPGVSTNMAISGGSPAPFANVFAAFSEGLEKGADSMAAVQTGPAASAAGAETSEGPRRRSLSGTREFPSSNLDSGA